MTEEQKMSMEDVMTSLYAAKLTMDAQRDMGPHMAIMAIGRALQNAFELAAGEETCSYLCQSF